MPAPDRLAEQFELHRAHIRAVAYRMLGSVAEADDAVQEAWLRLSRTDVSGVGNLRGWLTTVVARICLDMLRTRMSRREESLDTLLPDAIVTVIDRTDRSPETAAMLADSVGLALLVVLEKLDPAERLAFVLHDVFGMSFDEIASILDRSAAAARQLASRARRRVRSDGSTSEVSLRRQRRVVDAFLAAVQEGDFEALVAVLHPDIVLRADGGSMKGMTRLVRGPEAVAGQAAAFSKIALSTTMVLVNGKVGVLTHFPDGRPFSLISFGVVNDQILEMNVLADPDRLKRLDPGRLLRP